MSAEPGARRRLPSVDRLLRAAEATPLIERFGRGAVTAAIRDALAALRAAGTHPADGDAGIMARAATQLAEQTRPALRQVFNLTGTVLHTNLGRAALPEEAIDALAAACRGAVNLEYDLEQGRRGRREDHLEQLLCRLTGAEAATVVNNNAAALLLVLNTLAPRREVPVSRGELIEIGGSFRLPEIMARAGCRLREIGTTNRTHLRDYAEAIGPKTALVMKVHCSNYSIEGFTASVAVGDLAALARGRGLPLVVDLGSGALVDLRRFGLAHEPTPGEAIAAGADLVAFSGDKLLGGPQAGIIVGRAALIERIDRNPLKRALRVDRMTVASLAAVLALYLDPDRLRERVPALRLLARDQADLRAAAQRLAPALERALAEGFEVEIVRCASEVGGGAMPGQRIASAALAIRPSGRAGGAALARIGAALRALPVPVIGRIESGALLLDLRGLEPHEEARFSAQLALLRERMPPAR